MHRGVFAKLFVMMVLEFIVWGAWLPLIYYYLPSLNFTAGEQSWILNAFPVAAIVGMFFSNQFADRNFAAEKFLGFSHLIGGVAIGSLAFINSFWPFFLAMLIHCLLFVPTLSIVNSIAFAHLKDPKDFGRIRAGGTIGWVIASWPFTFILVDWDKVHAANPAGAIGWIKAILAAPLTGAALQSGIRWTYIVSGIASLTLAVFSLILPHTPANKAHSAEDKLAWLEALRMLKKPFILVLWLVTFVDTFVLFCYFNWAGTFLASKEVGIPGNLIMPVMSIGQIAEILTMTILGMTLKKLGWRMTMILGILGHVVRFAVFAFLPQATGLIVAVNILHGICYAFFFAAVYIFVDEYFPKDARSSGQGLFNVMILGLGVIAANSVGPLLLQNVFTTNGVTDYRGLFLIPGGAALLAAIALALFFHPPAAGERKEEEVLSPAATH
jgi:predicted MFS family arabinose efflux permease